MFSVPKKAHESLEEIDGNVIQELFISFFLKYVSSTSIEVQYLNNKGALRGLAFSYFCLRELAFHYDTSQIAGDEIPALRICHCPGFYLASPEFTF